MDCIKMWPWMRDLPTSVWAGRGWAFNENGLRRLSSTGGSGAMQGVEVFASVGAAAERLKLKDEIIKDAASAAPHAALPVASAEGLKPTKFMRNNLVKQSGVPGVLWNSTCFAWEVQIPKYDSEGKRKGETNRKFSISKFMVNGRSEAEADAAALEAAKAFHAELVRKGIVKEPKERDPTFTSDVPGVLWSKESKKWRVRISLKKSNPKEPQKKVSGCYEIPDGSCVSVDIGLRLQRKAQASLQGCSPGNLNLVTLSMESPQAESSAKRRRLTHRDMHVAAGTEGSSSEKKESECEDVEDDSVRITKEKVAEQIHSMDEDVQWLKVKKEITDDKEQDMKSSSFDDFDDVPLKEVEVKDEMESEEEDHDKSPQKSEVAVKKEVRRRLKVAAGTEGSSSEKKESECEDVEDDSVKVKKEKIAEQIHSVDADVQWLKVKKEIKEETEQDMKSSSFGLVEVKDEMESEEEDHDKSPKKSEVAVKKEVQRRLLCVSASNIRFG